MALPYSDKIIPHHRRGAEVLLESADFDIGQLSAEQLAAIRRIYALDDPRTIADRVVAGDLE